MSFKISILAIISMWTVEKRHPSHHIASKKTNPNLAIFSLHYQLKWLVLSSKRLFPTCPHPQYTLLQWCHSWDNKLFIIILVIMVICQLLVFLRAPGINSCFSKPVAWISTVLLPWPAGKYTLPASLQFQIPNISFKDIKGFGLLC